MRFLLIGMSRFARRRVLPAVSAMEEIDNVDIASRHAEAAPAALFKPGMIFTDWRAALDEVGPSLVYVSLVNGDHAAAVRHALERGHHVVVDKPAFREPEMAEEMVSLARSSSLVLAEATCYAFHPVFDALSSVFRDHESSGTKATAVFTPPVPVGDFRYDRERGGGALLDTGPYMASLGRVLWGAEPEQVNVIVSDRTSEGVETSYSVLAGYPGARTIVGHFGFTTVYQNSLRLQGKRCAAEVVRPFSILPGAGTGITIDADGERSVRWVDPADSMHLFLSRVLRAVDSGSREFDDALLMDARTLERLCRSAWVTQSGR